MSHTIPFNTMPKTGNLCCKQVKRANAFSNTVTEMTNNIYNKLNCKSNYLICIVECTLCKRQYTGKSETAFSVQH